MNDVRLIHGDCLEVLRTLGVGSVDAVVTDPPYPKLKGGVCTLLGKVAPDCAEAYRRGADADEDGDMKTWVKLYTEINHDPKLGNLSWAQRGIWAALLALAGEIDARDEADDETGMLDTPENTAWRLRCDPTEFDETIAVFTTRGMIEERGGLLYVVHYVERQKRAPSDSHERVRERVTRHRKQACNESVTPLQENVTRVQRGVTSTDTDTDTDKNRKDYAPTSGAAAVFTPPPAVVADKPLTHNEIENQKRLAVEEYFADRSKIPRPAPKNEKQRTSAGELWWYPLRKILTLVDWDVGKARELIDKALEALDGRDLTISNPKSILNTAVAIHARQGRGGNGHGAIGGRDSPGKRTDGWTREQIALELERREQQPDG